MKVKQIDFENEDEFILDEDEKQQAADAKIKNMKPMKSVFQEVIAKNEHIDAKKEQKAQKLKDKRKIKKKEKRKQEKEQKRLAFEKSKL